jgi:hypothetical protein
MNELVNKLKLNKHIEMARENILHGQISCWVSRAVHVTTGQLYCAEVSFCLPGVPYGGPMGQIMQKLASGPNGDEVMKQLIKKQIEMAYRLSQKQNCLISLNIRPESLEVLPKLMLDLQMANMLDPQRIVFELTDMIPHNGDEVLIIKTLRDDGFLVFLDDVGGYYMLNGTITRTRFGEVEVVNYMINEPKFLINERTYGVDGIKLDYERVIRLHEPNILSETIEFLRKIKTSQSFPLILEGVDAPRENPAWQNAVRQICALWGDDVYIPLPLQVADYVPGHLRLYDYIPPQIAS